MSLRVKIELQRSSKGIEMAKLEKLTNEAQRLLRSLADDLGIQADGVWVAQGFYDQGLGFDATYQASDVDDLQAAAFLRSLDHVLTVDSGRNWIVPGVSVRTLIQSASLAKIAEEDETIRIGLYNGTPAVEWRPLTRSRAEAIVEYFNETVKYRGMVQGVIHTWYKESEPPHFALRDLASRELLKCYYQQPQYADLHAVTAKRGAVVLVSGWIQARRSTRAISRIDVERIQATNPISRPELEAFFGSAPGWTGDLTTDDFIDQARRRDDGD